MQRFVRYSRGVKNPIYTTVNDNPFGVKTMNKADKIRFDRVGWLNDDGTETSCWLARIDTQKKFKMYLDVQSNEDMQIWFDIKNSPEDKMGHCRTRKASTVKNLLNLRMEKEGKRSINIVDGMAEIAKLTIGGKAKLFIQDGEIYVNIKGGYRDTHLRDDGRLDEFIFETCYNEDLIYPSMSSTDVEATKWFGGNHFYITVNGATTDVDGKEKWNTIEAAEEAKETIIKRNRFKDSVKSKPVVL